MSKPTNFSEMLDKALPKMEKFPKAKQQAIGEALTMYKHAKTLELEAMHALLDALKQDYQFWVVEGRTSATRSGHTERRIIAGADGPDVERRARRAGFTRIFHISPLDSTDGSQN